MGLGCGATKGRGGVGAKQARGSRGLGQAGGGLGCGPSKLGVWGKQARGGWGCGAWLGQGDGEGIVGQEEGRELLVVRV